MGLGTYIDLGDIGGLDTSSLPSDDIETSDIKWLISVSVRGLTVTSVLTVMKDDGPRVWTTEDFVDLMDSATEVADAERVDMPV